jgi:hypothetical protein
MEQCEPLLKKFLQIRDAPALEKHVPMGPYVPLRGRLWLFGGKLDGSFAAFAGPLIWDLFGFNAEWNK